MPDKNNLAANELVDRGWQQMSDLLDQEMPQRDRRRGAAWIWWGIGALVILAGALLVFPATDNPGIDPEEPAPGPHHTATLNPAAVDDQSTAIASESNVQPGAGTAAEQRQTNETGGDVLSTLPEAGQSDQEKQRMASDVIRAAAGNQAEINAEAGNKLPAPSLGGTASNRTDETDLTASDKQTAIAEAPELDVQDAPARADVAAQAMSDAKVQQRIPISLTNLDVRNTERLVVEERII
ncbi:MAG: hypothetical protein R3330_08520, partial [Saprospiraceae bacterium]|nr:hypothetical protein [Saprospiraceae bacterium]